VHGFGGAVPACVVGVSRVSASVYTRLFDSLDTFVLKTLFNLKELSTSRLINRMASCSNSCIPGGTLGAEHVPVNLVLHLGDNGLGALVIWIIIIVPPIEASLVASIGDLAVMD